MAESSGRRSKWPEQHYRDVAEVYQSAISAGTPTRTVSEQFGVTYQTAVGWVRRCRRMGLIVGEVRGGLRHLSPEQRGARAAQAAQAKWAKTVDRAAATAPARAAFMKRFDDEVDPDGVLSPAERAEQAEAARAAYFGELALRSAQARAT